MTFRSFSCVALALSLSLAAAGCGDDDSPTSPSNSPRFTASLSPANEVPPVTNAESTVTGNVAITMNTTTSGSNITAATADFTVTLGGLPTGSVVTLAHIHTGAAGSNGGVVWDLALSSSTVTIVNGAATITRTSIAPGDIATAQAIINNPAGFYFNVHTALNGGGVVRGQLARSN